MDIGDPEDRQALQLASIVGCIIVSALAVLMMQKKKKKKKGGI